MPTADYESILCRICRDVLFIELPENGAERGNTSPRFEVDAVSGFIKRVYGGDEVAMHASETGSERVFAVQSRGDTCVSLREAALTGARAVETVAMPLAQPDDRSVADTAPGARGQLTACGYDA